MKPDHAPDTRPDPSPRLSLVTGASSGLGRALSERLAKAGSDLVLVARDRARLEETASDLTGRYAVKAEVIPADLSDPGAAGDIFDHLRRRGLTADLLVNDAGFNVYGRFEDTDLDRELEMIRLHLVATTQLAKLFLQSRDRTKKNRILNVSSIAALVPGPCVSVHFATRAHLLSFSLALCEEFRGSDVGVTCLCPGPMVTNFFKRAGMTDVRLISGWPMQIMTAPQVAACGYKALMAGRPMVIPGWRNRILAFAADIAPRPIKIRFTRWVMARI